MSSFNDQHQKFVALLLVAVTAFSLYFSIYTIKRYQKGYAHYYDLAIMHQTVYNTFKSFKTGHVERFLELSDPHQSTDQVKRMSVHNDIFLALLAPFYFIHSGPETLLILQAVTTGIGAWFVFFISRELLKRSPQRDSLSIVLACGYLLYPPLQRVVTYEFHAVSFAPTILLAMHYVWMKSYRKTAFLLAILAITTKEQVGMTVAVWAATMWYREMKGVGEWRQIMVETVKRKILLLIGLSAFSWSLLSYLVIIPFFRGEGHFANSYYAYLSDGIFAWLHGLLRWSNGVLLIKLLTPLAFLPIISISTLLIPLPEWLIVTLSLNENMQNTYFHYHAVLIPFIFIAAAEGMKWIVSLHHMRKIKAAIPVILTICIVLSSFYWSAMPWSHQPDLYPWKGVNAYEKELSIWQKRLNDDSIRVSASGHLAPFFSGRRYYYDFSNKYPSAHFIVLDTYDVMKGYHHEFMEPAYRLLQRDWRYIKVYSSRSLEVYRMVHYRLPR